MVLVSSSGSSESTSTGRRRVLISSGGEYAELVALRVGHHNPRAFGSGTGRNNRGKGVPSVGMRPISRTEMRPGPTGTDRNYVSAHSRRIPGPLAERDEIAVGIEHGEL